MSKNQNPNPNAKYPTPSAGLKYLPSGPVTSTRIAGVKCRLCGSRLLKVWDHEATCANCDAWVCIESALEALA